MAIAALIISILALAAAGASTMYTKRYADAEVSRRHDERRPEFDVLVEKGPLLRLTLVSHEDLDTVEYQVQPEGAAAAGAHPIEGLGSPVALRGQFDGLTVGVPMTVRIVEAEKGRGGAAGLRLTSHRGRSSWVTSHRIEVPPGAKLLS